MVQKLTPEEKQSALKRHKDIVLATLDYLLEQFAGSIIYDHFDPIADYYKQQKLQTEKYYTQRRLDRLQQRLSSLTEGLKNRVDLEFGSYIKKKTGYDIDIFESLQNHIATIIAQRKISSQKELNAVGTMLRFYEQTSAEQEKVDILKNLLIDFSERTRKQKSVTKNNYKSNQLSVAVSPDGKRKLTVNKSIHGENVSKYVVIEFGTASGPIFGITGINPDINAYWKDNNTIIIQTQKGNIVNTKYEQVQSFADIVKIEYVEV